MKRSLTPTRPEYYVQTGSMFENPHGVPHDEIVQMILEAPAEVAAQVIFGKYVESSGLVFSGELIQSMIDRDIPRVTTDRWVDKDARQLAALYRERDPSGASMRVRWHTGIDFARQTDYTVLTTIDTYTMPSRVVAYRRLNRVPWEAIYTEVGRAVLAWGPSVLVDDTGPGGDVVFDALESRLYCPVHDRCNLADSRCQDRAGNALLDCRRDQYLPLSCADGYTFGALTKKQLVEHLRNVMSVGYRRPTDAEPVPPEFGWIRTPPIVQLEEEMSFYVWDDKGLETDCLFSLALAAWQGMEEVVLPPAVGSPWGV